MKKLSLCLFIVVALIGLMSLSEVQAKKLKGSYTVDIGPETAGVSGASEAGVSANQNIIDTIENAQMDKDNIYSDSDDDNNKQPEDFNTKNLYDD